MNERKVLVVDDDDDILLIVQTLLGAGYDTVVARNGNEGIEQAAAVQPDLVLLDVTMPNLSGWEVCATLQSLPETASIPVVMLTVKSEINDLVTGLQVGADDFVTKPFTKATSSRRSSAAWRGATDRARSPCGRCRATRARALLFDTVTGLPTIPVITDALRERLLVDQDVGVLLIDVDERRPLEDHYGWEVFDEVLREASRGLKRLVGTLFSAEDLIAVNRPSGSEFYVFCRSRRA